jgi:hypothetical protein
MLTVGGPSTPASVISFFSSGELPVLMAHAISLIL